MSDTTQTNAGLSSVTELIAITCVWCGFFIFLCGFIAGRIDAVPVVDVPFGDGRCLEYIETDTAGLNDPQAIPVVWRLETPTAYFDIPLGITP